MTTSIDAAIAAGEVTALKQSYQVGNSTIPGAEVDRWRKLAAIQIEKFSKRQFFNEDLKMKSETEAIFDLSKSIEAIADSITRGRGQPGTDELGGTVDCLTESLMGVTAGLCRIADAIERVADVMAREHPKG